MKLNFYFKFFSIFLLCSCFLAATAQQRQITGKVVDDSNLPLPGASVSVKGGKAVTRTNQNGNFTIEVPSESSILLIKFLGMTSLEVNVANQTSVNVKMASSSSALDEVVVVGYGSQKKADLTGAVGSIKGEQLSRVATTDVVQAMQGRIAGVSVMSNSGQPGSGAKITIRGLGSLSGGSPVYVVDGYQTSDISYLAPNDISNIDVLKDASATAIYGSRGANGVVMITTKKGQNGPAKFSFDSYTGLQQAWKTIPMVNATQYAKLVTQGYTNEGQSVPVNLATRLDFLGAGNFTGTNWQKEIFQKGIMQNHTLTASGGSERNKFRLSGTYFEQEGIIKNSGMKKFFLNFVNDLNVNKWLTTGVSANFINYDKTYYNGDYYSGVLTNALMADPIAAAWDKDTNNWGRADVSFMANPARVVSFLKNNKGYGTSLVGNVYADAKIVNGLSFKTQFGTSYNASHNKSYNPKFNVDVQEQNLLSSLSESRGAGLNWVWTNYFNYNKSFGDHSLNAMVGAEVQDNSDNNIHVTAYNVPAESDLQYLEASKNIEYNVGSGQGANGMRSFFGRVNYNYKSKYLLTATLRNDA
ncbi:MAG: SusC/RagA family TonB-linked outer membrane protein, partial [Pedobacter sp.]|nr:SusC/RagA family TonB-linked outer membrane protein [Pedobacter sp.]